MPFANRMVSLQQLQTQISKLMRKYLKNDLIVVGNFNIDLLAFDTFRHQLKDMMVSEGMLQQVTLPSRQTLYSRSLIDPIYTYFRSSTGKNVNVQSQCTLKRMKAQQGNKEGNCKKCFQQLLCIHRHRYGE